MSLTTRDPLLTLSVAVAITLAVGSLTAQGWPGYVVGAVLSLTLWMMLFFGSGSGFSGGPWVSPRDFALAAMLAVALGYLLFRIGNDNAAFWGSGVIIVGVMWGPATRARLDGDES